MNPLVTPAWLHARLNDPDTVILDATLPPVGVKPAPDVRARYFAEHIPGAIYFDIEAFSDHSTSLPHMLQSPEAFSLGASTLGISDEATIVVYEQEGVFSAPRAWWMFRTFGAHKVFLLDGGIKSWKEAGFPVQAGPVHRATSRFNAKLNHEAVKSFADIQQIIAGHSTAQSQVLDARSSGRFTGTAPEPRPEISSGHMPGAVSLPFTELVENGRLKSSNQLGAIFDAKGVNLNESITTSCGSGVTAAVLALGLEIAGARNVSLYDGSWAEYAQRPEAVIEKQT